MKIFIVLLCKDQENLVDFTISKIILQQERQPDGIIVVNDSNSKLEKINNIPHFLYIIENGINLGRSKSRNIAIDFAFNLGADVIIFFDGDSFPKDGNLILYYEKLFKETSKPTSIYGMRENIPFPKKLEEYNSDLNYEYIPVNKMPSCILHGNINEMYHKENINLDDYRCITGVVDKYINYKTFDEKIDLILTSMVTWSCNFAVDKETLNRIKKINGYYFDPSFIGWGYEDVAFGLDSMFVGSDVILSKDIWVRHFLHNTSDDDNYLRHIDGHHTIMSRYRRLMDLDLSEFFFSCFKDKPPFYQCCCECENLIEDHSHPYIDGNSCLNINGYICIATVGNETMAHSCWPKHSIGCELHIKRKNK